MSILYDQLYTSSPLIPNTTSSKAFQHTTMYQAANGTSATRNMSASTKSNMTSRSEKSVKSDASSMTSYSSTASTIALIKNKFKTSGRKEEKSPGEKQAERKKDRMSNVTLAQVFALK